MDKDAATVVAELRQDHQNMALMLNLIERESNKIFKQDEPDYELLRNIMEYMTVYPDAVHHPKEDRIYAELKAVRPGLSSDFTRITMDHRHISELGLQLCQDIDAIRAEGIVQRNAVVSNALRYVNTLRGHMQWEERDLFRRIDKMIADGHNVIEVASFTYRTDPVFGAEVEARFSGLVEDIRAYSTN